MRHRQNKNTETYFAYGSNINMRQMKARCPSAEFAGQGMLVGYRLDFVLYSKGRWGGGVAGIVPETDGKVTGVLYQVSDSDLEKLDKIEGVPRSRYVRKRVSISKPDGTVVEAWTYVANPEIGGPFTPSLKYLETIIEGAKEHGLPEGYIREMEKLKNAASS
jgi:gamma-glutamylcyclotransferase (GGCT)/AIG2-like uncharacterized protein YtfP